VLLLAESADRDGKEWRDGREEEVEVEEECSAERDITMTHTTSRTGPYRMRRMRRWRDRREGLGELCDLFSDEDEWVGEWVGMAR
jgi:hypothetical protein